MSFLSCSWLLLWLEPCSWLFLLWRALRVFWAMVLTSPPPRPLPLPRPRLWYHSPWSPWFEFLLWAPSRPRLQLLLWPRPRGSCWCSCCCLLLPGYCCWRCCCCWLCLGDCWFLGGLWFSTSSTQFLISMLFMPFSSSFSTSSFQSTAPKDVSLMSEKDICVFILEGLWLELLCSDFCFGPSLS